MNSDLYINAGFVDDVKDKVWNKDAGIFQNALNVAGIGAILGLGGNIGLLVGVANFLGIGLPQLGKYLDDALGDKSLADVDFDELGEVTADKIWSDVTSVTATSKNNLMKNAADLDPELAAKLDKEIDDVTKTRTQEPKKVVRVIDSGKADRAARLELERLKEQHREKARKEQWAREDAVAAAKEKREIEREERRHEREDDKSVTKGIQERAKITQKQMADKAKADAAAAERARREKSVSEQEIGERQSRSTSAEEKRKHDLMLEERARKIQLEDEARKLALREKEARENRALSKSEYEEKRKYEAKKEKMRHKNALELLKKRQPGTVKGLKSMGGKTGLALALAGLAAFLFSHFGASSSAETSKPRTEESRERETSSRHEENVPGKRSTTYKGRKAVLDGVIKEILNQ